MRIETAFDLGFDVRGEVVDHVLHDRLGSRAQFFVQMHRVARIASKPAPTTAIGSPRSPTPLYLSAFLN